MEEKDFKKYFIHMSWFIVGFVAAIVMCGFFRAYAESNPEISPVGISEKAPMTWQYLGSIAGCTAATVLISQFLKFPLDKIWKIPTRVMVYVIALTITIASGYFLNGKPTIGSLALDIVNSFVVATSAYGCYELTFAKSKN